LCFFIQAEDGIRDKLVTGVQTCALPIWIYSAAERRALAPWIDPGKARTQERRDQGTRRGFAPSARFRECKERSDAVKRLTYNERSEERRVGKECTSRKARDEERKNKKDV